MATPDDHRVRVEPSGVEFGAGHGESVMDAALRNGVSWPSVCERVGDCRACMMHVRSDQSDNLSIIGPWERSNLDAGCLRSDPGRGEPRLACQAEVLRDVTVIRRGVRHHEAGAFPP